MMRQRTAILCGIAAMLALPAVVVGQETPGAPVLRVEQELTTRNVRTEESNLGSLIADAIRAVDKSQIALIAATSFADVTLPKGDVKADDVLRALVFRGDTVVVMKLKGSQVKTALEHALSLYPARSAAFLQVSGLKVTVDPSADRNARVVSVMVGKEPLDESRVYSVAMPSPLAGGALVYSRAWSRDDMERDTRKTMEEAVREFLASNPTITARTGDRIVFKR